MPDQSIANNPDFNNFMAQGLEGADAAMKKYAKPDKEGADKINKERDEIKADEDKIAFPTAPPKMQNTDPMQVMGSAAGWIATLGSLLTKHPLQSALNSSASAINAAKSGDQASYDKAMENWKANDQLIKDQQEFITNKLKNAKSDAELKVQADALGIPGLSELLRTPGGGQKFVELYMKLYSEYQKQKDRVRDDLSVKMETAAYVRDKVEEAKRNNPNITPQEIHKIELQAQGEAKSLADKGNVSLGSENKEALDMDSLKGTDIVPHTGMTKDAIDYAAKAFNLNDTKTAFAGLTAVRSKGDAMNAKQTILNRAAQLREQGGVDGPADVIATGTDIKGLTAASVQQEKQNAAVETFANTAKDNLNNALKLAKEGGIPTDMGPWLNRYVQEGETALGDPNIPPFTFALLTGVSEAAKVLSGSMGAAAATDTARKEVAEGFNKAYDYKTLENVVRKVVDVDIANRTKENARTLKDLHDKIAGAGKTQKKTPNSAAIKHLKEHPDTKSEFDEYFGKGAADKALGGS